MSGRDRKSSLKALFGEPLAPSSAPAQTPMPAPETKSMPVDVPAAPSPSPSPARATSGAVKAMGLSLSTIAREAEEAKALRQALEEGERVLELETGTIDVSFVRDRLTEGDHNDPEFSILVESIRESGQQVPILVRPHPQTPGRFQVAYGHRRLRAAERLGISVKALVRPLADDELVLAQGKENAERRNLSFIERALFAKALVERGFDRKLIGDALAIDKTELSRLIQVADAIPIQFIRGIGPAPKAGRSRWMELGGFIATQAGYVKATDELHSERFKAADSDTRFRMLYDRLARRHKPPKPPVEVIKGPDGISIGRLSRKGRTVRIEFSADVDTAFLERLRERLGEDYAAFVRGGSGKG